MLGIMIYLSLKLTGINLLDLNTYPKINENRNLSTVQLSGCKVVEGKKDSFLGIDTTNNTYKCN